MTPADLEPGERVWIYGAGVAGRSLLAWLLKTRPDVQVQGFIDPERSGRFCGRRLLSQERFRRGVARGKQGRILIASGHAREIHARLEQSGLGPCAVVPIPVYLLGEIFPEPWSERLLGWMVRLVSRGAPKRAYYFFGEYGGRFTGNNKYFYLYLRGQGLDPVWVTQSSDIGKELDAAGLTVRVVRSIRDFLGLRDGRYFVMDTMTWVRACPFLRHFGARILHTSHGVGMKTTLMMQLPEPFLRALTAVEFDRITERLFRNHLLVSTSAFYAEQVSVPAHHTPRERVVCCGYPRNDVLYQPMAGEEIFVDRPVLEAVRKRRREGWSVVVYAPTFRDNRLGADGVAPLDEGRLTAFLRHNRILLVLKTHPHAREARMAGQDVCLVHAHDRDLYPLLRETDLLITDYSSIAMDFLHTGRPILYFPYDLEAYQQEHHDIQFPYETVTPGPQARTWRELEAWMKHFLVEGKDGFEARRQELMGRAFDHADGRACERLYERLLADD